MKDGDYVFFAMQHRATHKSPWLKPEGPLQPETDRWTFSSWDFFGEGLNPHVGTGNDWRAQWQAADEEQSRVWSQTGQHGWFTLKYAARALKRMRRLDAAGKFDSHGPYGEHTQAVRHEFRLVKMTVSQKTEPVTCDDLLEAVA